MGDVDSRSANDNLKEDSSLEKAIEVLYIQDIFSILNAYLDKLDRVLISSEGIFKSENEKEKYETLFMYSFRKYKAAQYHYENIKTFIKEEVNKANRQKSLLQDRDKPSGLKSTFKLKSTYKRSGSVNHYAYELSAFVEALKSSIDFIATACILHFQGFQGDSIKTLIKLAKKKNKTGPIIDEVKRNLDWIISLRTYRHHLVHKLMIRTSGGYEIREEEDFTKTIIYPVIIPKLLPMYIPDTRKTREEDMMMRDISDLYDTSWTEVRINGKFVESSVEVHPPRGFVLIDRFMESHLNSYRKFFNEILNRLSDIDFRIIIKKSD